MTDNKTMTAEEMAAVDDWAAAIEAERAAETPEERARREADFEAQVEADEAESKRIYQEALETIAAGHRLLCLYYDGYPFTSPDPDDDGTFSDEARRAAYERHRKGLEIVQKALPPKPKPGRPDEYADFVKKYDAATGKGEKTRLLKECAATRRVDLDTVRRKIARARKREKQLPW